MSATLYSTHPTTLAVQPAGGRDIPRFKRPLDIVGATLLLLVLSPIIVLAAIAIRFTSPGPIFFRQERVGHSGVRFVMFKFRSMYIDAEARLTVLHSHSERDGVCFKMRDDPRVTSIGRWFRRFSVDEIPQLFNVIIGDMSLVGPRPALPHEVDAYPINAFGRLSALPGITGVWQVSGRADISFEQMIEMDIEYIRNCSLAKDLRLLLATIGAVFSARGAY